MDQPSSTQAPEQSSAPTSNAVPTPPAPGVPSKSNGLAIAALVLGIVAFLFGWIGFFNLLVAVLAIVFGIIALVKHQNKAFALIGTILGGIGLLTSLIVGIFFTAAIFNGAANYESNTSTSTTSDSSVTSDWDVTAAYEKVSTGMTKAQVEEATGKSSENCASTESDYGTYETCYYGSSISDNGTITVSYTDGKVSTKSKYSNQ